jgi:hypothetical protein
MNKRQQSKQDVFKLIEERIGIPFVMDHFEEGEVCFVNNEAIRYDFKLQFTTYDVIHYIYGVVDKLYWKENEKSPPIQLLEIPLPVNGVSFWEYCEIGKNKRLKCPIETIEFVNISDLNWSII